MRHVARAQHYCVRTRLLDWLGSSYVAAYFAATSAMRIYTSNPDAKELKLTVWRGKDICQ